MTDVTPQPTQQTLQPNGMPPPPPGSTGAPVTTAGDSVNAPTTKLQTATRAAPKLDPKTTVAVASSASSPADAASRAQIVTIFHAATNLGNALSNQPARAQAAFWNKASKPIRDMLDAAGYKPPKPPPKAPDHSGGFLDSVFHDVAHGFDTARHSVASGADTAGHGASKGWSWLTHEPSTTPRTWRTSAWTRSTTPSAWRSTSPC